MAHPEDDSGGNDELLCLAAFLRGRFGGLPQAFHALDANKHDRLAINEFTDGLCCFGYAGNVELIFHELDRTCAGFVSLPEFMSGFADAADLDTTLTSYGDTVPPEGGDDIPEVTFQQEFTHCNDAVDNGLNPLEWMCTQKERLQEGDMHDNELLLRVDELVKSRLETFSATMSNNMRNADLHSESRLCSIVEVQAMLSQKLSDIQVDWGLVLEEDRAHASERALALGRALGKELKDSIAPIEEQLCSHAPRLLSLERDLSSIHEQIGSNSQRLSDVELGVRASCNSQTNSSATAQFASATAVHRLGEVVNQLELSMTKLRENNVEARADIDASQKTLHSEIVGLRTELQTFASLDSRAINDRLDTLRTGLDDLARSAKSLGSDNMNRLQRALNKLEDKDGQQSVSDKVESNIISPISTDTVGIEANTENKGNVPQVSVTPSWPSNSRWEREPDGRTPLTARAPIRTTSPLRAVMERAKSPVTTSYAPCQNLRNRSPARVITADSFKPCVDGGAAPGFTFNGMKQPSLQSLQFNSPAKGVINQRSGVQTELAPEGLRRYVMGGNSGSVLTGSPSAGAAAGGGGGSVCISAGKGGSVPAAIGGSVCVPAKAATARPPPITWDTTTQGGSVCVPAQAATATPTPSTLPAGANIGSGAPATTAVSASTAAATTAAAVAAAASVTRREASDVEFCLDEGAAAAAACATAKATQQQQQNASATQQHRQQQQQNRAPQIAGAPQIAVHSESLCTRGMRR